MKVRTSMPCSRAELSVPPHDVAVLGADHESAGGDEQLLLCRVFELRPQLTGPLCERDEPRVLQTGEPEHPGPAVGGTE